MDSQLELDVNQPSVVSTMNNYCDYKLLTQREDLSPNDGYNWVIMLDGGELSIIIDDIGY